jgi:4-amino-4-deoxy-L-arabinose transferase-like glycosyltransferase
MELEWEQAHSTPSRGFSHPVLSIVVVAFVLRLLVITAGHTYRITPSRDHFQFGWETGRIARSIAEGHGFSSPTDLDSGPSAWTAPVYPYLLAGIFKIWGIYTPASAWVILAFNSFWAALTCWTLYLVAARIFGAWVARVTAWTWAVFPYLLYWAVRVVWETSLTTFLLTLVLWLTIRASDDRSPRGIWIYQGFLWGLILLTNTAVVILLPFFLAWAISRSYRRRALRGAAVCLGIMALCAVPWTIRNYRRFDRFLFVRDNLPLELYEANNDHSAGLWTRSEHPGNNPTAMKRMQELGEIAFMDEKQQQFDAFLREHPGEFVRFTLERVWYFWAAPPQAAIVAGYDLWVARHVQFLLASIFAFAGLVLAFARKNAYRWLLAPFLLIYPLPFYVVNPLPRYKHPIEPVMLMLIIYVLAESRGVEVALPWKRTARPSKRGEASAAECRTGEDHTKGIYAGTFVL